MKLRVLLIRNKSTAFRFTTDHFASWLKDHFLLDEPILIDTVDSDLPLKWKDFGVKLGGVFAFADSRSYWGLDGIKEQLRQANLVPSAKYHIVIFAYEVPRGYDLTNHPLGNWTYPNDLQTSALIEMPWTREWAPPEDYAYRVLTHEVLHGLHRLCWWKRIYTFDSMDLYDKEFEPDATDGNRARNIKEIRPHIPDVVIPPLAIQIQLLQEQIVALLEKIKNMAKSKLQTWAEATKIREGWIVPGQNPSYPQGSRSYRNNNPGNLKYSAYTAGLGASGKDDKGFARFGSYESGLAALMALFRDAANLELRAYRQYAESLAAHRGGEKYLTILDFYAVYAPTEDQNDPNSYALFVAYKLGVDPQTKIKTLI